MTLASTFIADGDSDYGRAGNATWNAFEEIVGALEGGQALAFASGQAATTAVLDLVRPGGTVVAPQHCYSGTFTELHVRADHGLIDLVLVDVTDTEAVIESARHADLLWIESPTNPMLDVADLETTFAGLDDDDRPILAVDNTFATPLRMRPLDLGADVVIHSASKMIAGHSDLILGVAVSRDPDVVDALHSLRTLHGAIAGAMETFLAARGARTLAVRLDRSETSATMLAERLSEHPAVERVRYPGFGPIVSFEVAGGVEAAERVCRASTLLTHATSLGGVETTWERRRRHAAEPEAVPEQLIRMSVGLEDVDDLWADIAQSLAP